MKFLNLFLTFFLLISFGIHGQISKGGSQNDAEKLLSWAQLMAYEQEVAISYKKASIRNGILEINDLSISSFISPYADIDKLDSFNAFFSRILDDQNLVSVKNKINLGYLENFFIPNDKR